MNLGIAAKNKGIARNMDRGASFVEAAISLPLFLMIVVFLVDLARYFFVYLVLSYAAHTAVDYASKLRIEEDTTCFDCPSLIADTPCARYLARTRLILNRALRFANMVSGAAESGHWAERIRFKHYGADLQGAQCSALGEFNEDVAFLRPGEQVKRLTGPRTGEIFAHPTRLPGGGSDQGWPHGGEKWGNVMYAHPVMVYIEAQLKTITPLIPKLMIRIRATSFRMPPQFGQAVVIPTTTTTSTTSTTTTTTTTTTSSTAGGGTGSTIPSLTTTTTAPGPSTTTTTVPTTTNSTTTTVTSTTTTTTLVCGCDYVACDDFSGGFIVNACTCRDCPRDPHM